MRVAYVVSTLKRCGPVNVLFDIVNNLDSSCEASVFTLAPEPDESRAGDFERIGVPVKQVFDSRVRSMLSGSRVLGREIARFAPDVVHAHGFRATLLCRNLPFARIVTVHNCIFEDFLTTYGRLRATWMTRSEVSALRRFDVVVACSESNADYLRREYGLEVETIRNGVDQTKYHPLAAAPRRELREKLGIGADTLALVATGGCSERKRTFPLVKAFSSALAEAGADAELHVFGEGPDYARCASLGLPRVHFHGFVADVVPWLQACDLFVSASASEGMPLAVLEAISCGLPALLSDIPPHREIADEPSISGCVALFEINSNVAVFRLRDILVSRQIDRPKGFACFSAGDMARQYDCIYRRFGGSDSASNFSICGITPDSWSRDALEKDSYSCLHSTPFSSFVSESCNSHSLSLLST